MKEGWIYLPEKRRLSYAEFGEAGRPAVFFFHGAPSSRLRLAHIEQLIVDAGLHIITPERPGYGKSDPQPGRTLNDWPSDVTTLADRLSVDSFIVAGHSSGGPYAVACAALIPERVRACVIVAGVTDMGWPDACNNFVESEALLMQLPDQQSVLDQCIQWYGEDGSGFMSSTDFDFTGPDLQYLTDEAMQPFHKASAAETFRQGVSGYAQDVFVQGHPWTFHPSDITCPVMVLHGDHDQLLPQAHSRHTAEIIPGAELRIIAGHGHMTILRELPGACSSFFKSEAPSAENPFS